MNASSIVSVPSVSVAADLSPGLGEEQSHIHFLICLSCGDEMAVLERTVFMRCERNRQTAGWGGDVSQPQLVLAHHCRGLRDLEVSNVSSSVFCCGRAWGRSVQGAGVW